MKLSQLKQQFLYYLESKLGRSAKTVENYDRYLNRFLAFVKVSKPSELTEDHVHEFRHYLNQQAGTMVEGKMMSMKEQTQNYHLIALRLFFKWLRQRGVGSVYPERIALVKVPDRSLEIISNIERESLILAPSVNTLAGKRDRAIIELLVSTGLRISELCGLLVSDVNLLQAELLVRGKRDKVRLISISKTAHAAIKNYLAARKDTEEALFVRHGKKERVGSEARISSRTVQRLLKYYAAKAGIISKVTPQIIRHSFAVGLLSTGTDLSSLQVRLGHAHIGTTQIYTKVTAINSKLIANQSHSKPKN